MSKKLKKQFRKQLIRHWLDHAAIFNARADETINRLLTEHITPRPWPEALRGLSTEQVYEKLIIATGNRPEDGPTGALCKHILPDPPAEIIITDEDRANWELHAEACASANVPIFAETNLWFDHEPMLYVVSVSSSTRPYLFAKQEEAEAFRDKVLDARDLGYVRDITHAWLFADAETAFTSFEADINYDG